MALRSTGGLELKLRKVRVPLSIRTSLRVMGTSFSNCWRQSVPWPVWDACLLGPSTKLSSGRMNATSATTAWSYHSDRQLTDKSIKGAWRKGTGTLPVVLTMVRPLILYAPRHQARSTSVTWPR
ncbi:hypothetical protein D3C80_1867110 [compost metagenome]